MRVKVKKLAIDNNAKGICCGKSDVYCKEQINNTPTNNILLKKKQKCCSCNLREYISSVFLFFS